MSGVISQFESRAAAIGALLPLRLAAAAPTRDSHLQRAEGSGRIVWASKEGRTYAADVFQKAPVRVLFPYMGAGVEPEAVFINTAGGIAGGDAFCFEAIAGTGTSAVITTQAAEKVYRALDEPARVATKLAVSSGAKLAWLPQETILFDGARLHRKTEIELSPGAELLALEWLVLGRAARSERMCEGEVVDSWRVRKDGRLIWADTLRVTEDVISDLGRPALLGGSTAIATLVYSGPDLESRLDGIREVLKGLPCIAGATSAAGLIIVRFAAAAPADLRAGLHSFLLEFNAGQTAAPFRVPKMWSC